jgi:hypothetical protein
VTADDPTPPPAKPRRVLTALFLLVLAAAFTVGFVLSGPGITYRLLGGALAGIAVVTLLAGVLAGLYAWLKVRSARAEAAAKPYIDQFDAMSDDELRESTLAAIQETGYFTTAPASAPVNPSWPRDVREVFERFDRVEFTLTGESKPYFTLDRSVVDLMAQYPGALKVGVMSLPAWSVVVHLPTGRSVVGYGSSRPDEIERSAKWPPSSHRSLWHLIAAHAVRHRVGLLSNKPAQTDVQPG